MVKRRLKPKKERCAVCAKPIYRGGVQSKVYGLMHKRCYAKARVVSK